MRWGEFEREGDPVKRGSLVQVLRAASMDAVARQLTAGDILEVIGLACLLGVLIAQ
jgi:hypothetical protein